MNFDEWFKFERGTGLLGAADRQRVVDICDMLRDPGGPAMDPEDSFRELCRYCEDKFSYAATGTGVSDGLRSGKLNCGAAADLTAGVVLYLAGGSLDVILFDTLFGGGSGVVTPEIDQAGVIMENNLVGGGSRMLFSGIHVVTRIEDEQFDLITGRHDHRIDFFRAIRADVNGQPTFTCDINGAHTLTKIDGKTAQGLSKFLVAPPFA